MELNYTLLRDVFTDEGTGGIFSGPGIEKKLYTAEDPVREPAAGRPENVVDMPGWVAAWKVKGKTAIPYGRYRVAWTKSTRFKRSTLQLLGVPGYEGIRIHAGNDADDTEGCPLVALARQADKTKILNSRPAVKYLEDIICRALERGIAVYVEVRKA